MEGRANGKKHCRVAVRALLGRSDFTRRFFNRWFDCCGSTRVSHESDYGREDAKQVAGVVAEVTGSEDRHQSDRVVQAVIKRPARSSGFLSYR